MIATVLALPALLAPAGLAATGGEAALRSTLAAQLAQGPKHEGAYVVDLSNGHVVFSDRDKRPAADGVVDEAVHDVDRAAASRPQRASARACSPAAPAAGAR